MESGGSGAEEEQVMSEVHLCCPPHFSGIHVSRFSFSSRPLLGVSEENDGDGSGGSVLIAGTSGSGGSPDAVVVDEERMGIWFLTGGKKKQTC